MGWITKKSDSDLSCSRKFFTSTKLPERIWGPPSLLFSAYPDRYPRCKENTAWTHRRKFSFHHGVHIGSGTDSASSTKNTYAPSPEVKGSGVKMFTSFHIAELKNSLTCTRISTHLLNLFFGLLPSSNFKKTTFRKPALLPSPGKDVPNLRSSYISQWALQ